MAIALLFSMLVQSTEHHAQTPSSLADAPTRQDPACVSLTTTSFNEHAMTLACRAQRNIVCWGFSDVPLGEYRAGVVLQSQSITFQAYSIIPRCALASRPTQSITFHAYSITPRCALASRRTTQLCFELGHTFLVVYFLPSMNHAPGSTASALDNSVESLATLGGDLVHGIALRRLW